MPDSMKIAEISPYLRKPIRPLDSFLRNTHLMQEMRCLLEAIVSDEEVMLHMGKDKADKIEALLNAARGAY